MVKNIIVSIFLILFYGCKDLHFKYPQPRGGKAYQGNINTLLNEYMPRTINSNDNNSILKNIINDTLRYVEINIYENNINMQLSFSDGIIFSEQFSDHTLTLTSFFSSLDSTVIGVPSDELIIIQKENFICVNRKDKNIYDIPFIFERNRSNNELNLYLNPFLLNDIEKFVDRLKNEFSIREYYDNDSSKIYVADPSYMSLRKYIKNKKKSLVGTPFGLNSITLTDLIVGLLFEQLEDNIKSDPTKYENIIDLINFENIYELMNDINF